MKMFVTLVLLLTLQCAYCTYLQPVPSYVCGEQVEYTEDNGVIISHLGFKKGHTYGKDYNCVWHITAPEGLNVKLTPLNFSLENSIECGFDALVLYDGNTTSSTKIGMFCGPSMQTVTSTQRYLTLEFHTDIGNEEAGFKLEYSFTTDILYACPDGKFSCGNGKCIPPRYVCDKDDDCGDDSDEANCHECTDTAFACSNGDMCVPIDWQCDDVKDCSDNSDETTCSTTPPPTTTTAGPFNLNCPGAAYRNDTNGTVTSPNYPGAYGSNMNCDYVIDIGGNTSSIEFTFDEEFYLEPHVTCVYDFVVIRGEDNEEFGQEIFGPFCGDHAPAPVTIKGSYAEVSFESDLSRQTAGFSVDWMAYE